MGTRHAFFSIFFSKHLSSVLGRTELCHEVRNPGPQKRQIIRDENHHLALLERGLRDTVKLRFFFVTLGAKGRNDSCRRLGGYTLVAGPKDPNTTADWNLGGPSAQLINLGISYPTRRTIPKCWGTFIREKLRATTEGQNRFRIFTLFLTHFQNFFPQDFPLQNKRVLAQPEQKRRKDNKKNRTNRCCTLVVARLSSS